VGEGERKERKRLGSPATESRRPITLILSTSDEAHQFCAMWSHHAPVLSLWPTIPPASTTLNANFSTKKKRPLLSTSSSGTIATTTHKNQLYPYDYQIRIFMPIYVECAICVCVEVVVDKIIYTAKGNGLLSSSNFYKRKSSLLQSEWCLDEGSTALHRVRI